MNPELDRAIQDFTSLALRLTEADLAIPWIWKDHDEEGIRFAFFVTLQELQQLAAQLEAARTPPTQAQWIVRQYQPDWFEPLHQRPALIYSAAAMLLGTQMMTIGFLAELITAYLGRDQESYSVKEKTTAGRQDTAVTITGPRSPEAGG